MHHYNPGYAFIVFVNFVCSQDSPGFPLLLNFSCRKPPLPVTTCSTPKSPGPPSPAPSCAAFPLPSFSGSAKATHE